MSGSRTEELWYTNQYVLSFREEVGPGAAATLHPTWGEYGGFDLYRPCRFRVFTERSADFQIERLTIDGHPQTLDLYGHGPCSASEYSSDSGRYDEWFDACPFGGRIDLCVRNESTEMLLFIAILAGPVRVAQSIVAEVASTDWSALTVPQRRAILYYGEGLGGGMPRKPENKKAMDDTLIALGLVAPFARGGCLPTARCLALASHLGSK